MTTQHPQYVITGTDTDVGKTIFAAALAHALAADYWKPIQAGTQDGTDSETVNNLAPSARILPESYCFKTPCSPHLASEIDGLEINIEKLTPPQSDRALIIEGAGGPLVPVNRTITYADIFARWQIPTIIIARTALGTINHSLSSIEALRSRKTPIHGIVFIGDEVRDSQKIICDMGCVTSLGRLPIISPLNSEKLAHIFADNFNIKDFMA